MASATLFDDDGDLEALSFGDKQAFETVNLKVEGAHVLPRAVFLVPALSRPDAHLN